MVLRKTIIGYIVSGMFNNNINSAKDLHLDILVLHESNENNPDDNIQEMYKTAQHITRNPVEIMRVCIQISLYSS